MDVSLNPEVDRQKFSEYYIMTVSYLFRKTRSGGVCDHTRRVTFLFTLRDGVSIRRRVELNSFIFPCNRVM